jgi:hypothetical protein
VWVCVCGYCNICASITQGQYNPGPVYTRASVRQGQYTPGQVYPRASITQGQYTPGPVYRRASITQGQYNPGPVDPMASITQGQCTPGPVYPRASIPQGHSAATRIISMKISSNIIESRTHDHSVCSAVPHSTAPPSACPMNVLCICFGLSVSSISREVSHPSFIRIYVAGDYEASLYTYAS